MSHKIDDEMVRRAAPHLRMTVVGYAYQRHGQGHYEEHHDPHPDQIRRALDAALNPPAHKHAWECQSASAGTGFLGVQKAVERWTCECGAIRDIIDTIKEPTAPPQPKPISECERQAAGGLVWRTSKAAYVIDERVRTQRGRRYSDSTADQKG